MHALLAGTNLYSRDLGKVVSTLALRPPACATENVTRAIRLQIQQLARDSLVSILHYYHYYAIGTAWVRTRMRYFFAKQAYVDFPI